LDFPDAKGNNITLASRFVFEKIVVAD
jgi:hypothetical protein